MSTPQRQGNRNLDSYVSVHTRVEKFREKYPTARLNTIVVKDEPLTVRCEIYLDDNTSDIPSSSGMADEAGGMGGRGNSTLEKVETAAVGRALAFLGFEVKAGIASAEEVEKASQTGPRAVAPTTDRTAVQRDKRAEGIAAMNLVTKSDVGYNVQTPSLKGNVVTYLVTQGTEGPACDCKEFQDATDPKFQCEHILAVKYAVKNKKVKDVTDESRLRVGIFRELNRLYQTESDINAYLIQNHKLDIQGVQSASMVVLTKIAEGLEIR